MRAHSETLGAKLERSDSSGPSLTVFVAYACRKLPFQVVVPVDLSMFYDCWSLHMVLYLLWEVRCVFMGGIFGVRGRGRGELEYGHGCVYKREIGYHDRI